MIIALLANQLGKFPLSRVTELVDQVDSRYSQLSDGESNDDAAVGVTENGCPIIRMYRYGYLSDFTGFVSFFVSHVSF